MDLDSSRRSHSSSDDEEDPIPTRVDGLWSFVNGENYSPEELYDRIESLANKLWRHKEKRKSPFRPIQPAEVEKLVETTVKLIRSSDNPRATLENRKLASRILNIIDWKLIDCEQTKLAYNVLMEALRAAIAKEEYSTQLIGSLARCMADLNYKHVITREEAADLMKQLIPVAGVAFYKETSDLSHEERYLLIDYEHLYELCPYSINGNYRELIEFLYSLASYYGFDEYYEYAKSVFQYAELKGVVNSEVLVVLNVLVIINSESYFGDKYGRNFRVESAQITMGLICISSDYIRGHLVYLLHLLLEFPVMFDFYDLSVLLIDHLLTKDDDPVADHFAFLILEQYITWPGVIDAYKGKGRRIMDKLEEREADKSVKREFEWQFRRADIDTDDSSDTDDLSV